MEVFAGLEDSLSILLGLDSSGVPFSVLRNSLGFKGLNELGLGPAALLADVSEDAELGSGLESHGFEGVGDDNLLFGVKGEGYSVEALESAKSGGSLGGFMGEHASDDSPKVSAGGLLMDGALLGVGAHSLSEEVHEFQLVSVMASRNEGGFTSDDDDSLALFELLGDVGGESTE